MILSCVCMHFSALSLQRELPAPLVSELEVAAATLKARLVCFPDQVLTVHLVGRRNSHKTKDLPGI